MTERGGIRDPFGLGGQSSRSANRGNNTNRDYSKVKYEVTSAIRPDTDRRNHVGSKSYGNDELREIVK
jgi:hypothetical protein